MEALWDLEDKWKLTTQEAVILFVGSAFLVIGVCTVMVLKRRARTKQLVNQEPDDREEAESVGTKWFEPRPGWCSMKKVLMSSVQWNRANKWEERISGRGRGRGRESPSPLLVKGGCEADVGWQSHNSLSPVWQRPILMGEKCELPRFSGLILYDERGKPVHHSDKETTHLQVNNYGTSMAFYFTVLLYL
ncbi:uncharacterized protein LOC132309701 [Cornus florida]|uniref:uncharacterized protein LOC132309701 n=1 Tax=Cornus florida TaxID=4283 RepID=UPI00289F51F3|nr:uncharacterized protein LOC132309701 [Cornus florida]